MTVPGPIKGALFVFLMFYGGLACSLVAFPSMLLVLIPSKRATVLRRNSITLIMGHLSRFAGLLIRALYGTRVFIYCNDNEILDEVYNKVLISSNHRTRIDWMFIIWIYGSVIRKISEMVVILKDDLKKIPIIGWCMQMMLYIFLQRKRVHDIPHIQHMLRHLMTLVPDVCTPGNNHLLALLIFPEGTDMSDLNVAKSNEYAKGKSLAEMKYVLYPKSTGLTTAIECFRQRDREAAAAPVGSEEGSVLHDLTMAYEDHTFGVRPSEMDLYSGNFPLAVHVRVDRYLLKDLPQHEAGLSQWVQDSFTRKESLLKEFYTHFTPTTHKDMDSGGSETSSSLSSSAPVAVPCTLPSWPPLVSHPLSPSQSSFSQSTLTLLVISFLMACLTLGLRRVEVFRYYALVVALTCTACLYVKRTGGLDNIELNLHGEEGCFYGAEKLKKK